MNLILSKDAHKQFEKLPIPDQTKVKRKLQALTEDPLAGKKLVGVFVGFRSLRVWPYRIIYEIEKINPKTNRIVIHKIQHRQGVYK